MGLSWAGRFGRAAREERAAVQGALKRAELVVRGELLRGEGERLAALLPSFAFLVVLPLLGKGEALRISERAAELLDSGGPTKE